MKRLITSIAIMAIAALLTSSAIPASADNATFSDVPATHWANNHIERAAAEKLVRGYEDGTFRPDNQMTKLEFLNVVGGRLTAWDEYSTLRVVLCRTKEEGEAFIAKIEPPLPVGHWASASIRIAYKCYVINEDDSEFVNLNEPITRGEIAKVLSRLEIGRQWMRHSGWSAMVARETSDIRKKVEAEVGKDLNAYSLSQVKELENTMLNADTSDISKNIADWNSIPKAYQPYVANVYKNGLVNGYDDGTFGADRTVTRAEAATMLMKACDYFWGDRNR